MLCACLHWDANGHPPAPTAPLTLRAGRPTVSLESFPRSDQNRDTHSPTPTATHKPLCPVAVWSNNLHQVHRDNKRVVDFPLVFYRPVESSSSFCGIPQSLWQSEPCTNSAIPESLMMRTDVADSGWRPWCVWISSLPFRFCARNCARPYLRPQPGLFIAIRPPCVLSVVSANAARSSCVKNDCCPACPESVNIDHCRPGQCA